MHLNTVGASGGSLATILGLSDAYSGKELARSMDPYSLSTTPKPKSVRGRSLLGKLFGYCNIDGLGPLTTAITGAPNVVIVHRSWSLMGALYGPRFNYKEYMSVPNPIIGVVIHFALMFGMLALSLSPFRWLMKKIVTAPGDGPAREATAREEVELRAIGTADQKVSSQQRAVATFKYKGGIYFLTGVLVAEAAMVLLKDETVAKRHGGGVLTPATLGQPFVDRLNKAGVSIESSLLG